MSKVYPSAEVITAVTPHPNADRLEVVNIVGATAVVPKDMYIIGEIVDFFPPDVTMKEETATKLGVIKYLRKTHEEGVYRVVATKIRGSVSYGIITKPPKFRIVEEDLSIEYNTGKYEPLVGKIMLYSYGFPCPEWFKEYTEIEHYYRNTSVLEDDMEIYVSEKLHGTQSRVSMYNGKLCCGSHHRAVKEFDGHQRRSVYWMASDVLKPLLMELSSNGLPVIVYGEIYGPGVQFMHYGLKAPTFSVFDIRVGKNYLNYEEFKFITTKYNISTPPVIYIGPFKKELVENWTSGHTLHDGTENIKGFSGREGCVIKPVIESWSHRVGRVVLKSVSSDYFSAK